VPGGSLMVAGAFGSCGVRVGAGRGQAGFARADADLAELVSDPLRRPGGLDGVGVAQVQQPAVGHASEVGPVDGAEGGQGLIPGGPLVGAAAVGSGPMGSVGWS
jgi:hypothetical protein